MKKILIDEMPLNNDVLLARDYCGKIIYRLWGRPVIFEKSSNEERLDNIIILNRTNTNITLSSSNVTLLDHLKTKLDFVYNNCKGFEQTFMIGIILTFDINGNKHLYRYIDGLLEIQLKSEERIYPFTCFLKSHYFYERQNNIISTKRTKKFYSELLDNDVCFFRVKNGFFNLFLFHLHLVDVTANTVFPYYLNKLYRKNRHFVSCHSGIECILVCTNKNSIFYKDRGYCKQFFSKINLVDMYNKLSCNITKSFLSTEYNLSEVGIEPIEISISYDDYYPNKIILKEMCKNFENSNIRIVLKKTDFFKIENDSDLRLYLFSNNYTDNIFIMYYIALLSGLQGDEEAYTHFYNTLCEYYLGKISKEICLITTKEILTDSARYFSVGEIESSFLARHEQLSEVYEK